MKKRARNNIYCLSDFAELLHLHCGTNIRGVSGAANPEAQCANPLEDTHLCALGGLRDHSDCTLGDRYGWL